MPDKFDRCEICGCLRWRECYAGPVRNGAFGSLTPENCVVGLCEGCGAQRLEERACKQDDVYSNESYRELVGEASGAADFWEAHDRDQIRNLAVTGTDGFRGQVVLDVGCGGGSFLDSISGFAQRTIGIEPCIPYHDALRSQGHDVFASLEEAVNTVSGIADVACCFSVIEHVTNPRSFLAGIRSLLDPEGVLYISTPNRNDILMDLLSEDYPSFFYRTVHRWYFDAESLKKCCRRAGFKHVGIDHRHRFGLANAMQWLRDRKPTGQTGIDALDDPRLDGAWQGHLRSTGTSDYLYAKLSGVE